MENEAAPGSNQNSQINIELVYALPDQQRLYLELIDSELTVEQAINQSSILNDYPEIDLASAKVGIFSKVCKLSDKLHDGDRIEIYRPLVADP